MKYAVVLNQYTDNIGDDVQTYAAAQLLPRVDYYLDREHLHQIEAKEEIKLISNGWFMNQPKHWPPQENIKPLLLSMYVDHKKGCPKYMLDNNLKPFYKENGPVGCRDLHTLSLFEDAGIESYFSACLTLTIQNKWKDLPKEKVLLVDPFVKILDADYQYYQSQNLIQAIPDECELISHSIPELHLKTPEERMKLVEQLLQKYATAKYIITSRIHCALPAVALGTPVFFIKAGYDRDGASNRLRGLLPFFNVIYGDRFPYSENNRLTKILRKFKLYQGSLPSPIDLSARSNPKADEVALLREALITRVKQFIAS